MTQIIAHAERSHRHPSEVFADYLEHPADYRLVWRWRSYVNEQERKAAEDARRG